MRNNPDIRRASNDKKRGRPLSEAHKKKLSEANKRNGHTPPVMSGENNPNWIGGTCLYWKKRAKERDDYKCRLCGCADKEVLHAHHIIPVGNEHQRRYGVDDINNLITLCANCHMKVHKGKVKLPNTGHLKSLLNNGKP